MTSPASAASNSCNGTLATITSTDRVINGTTGDDVILVRGPGKHTVNSGAGNDFICSGSGAKPVDFTVTGGIADDREPTVKSVEVSSSTLSAGDQFTVNYQGSDESGIEYFYGYFYHDGMGVANERGTYIVPNYFDVTRISGDAKDGTWQQSFTVSEFAPAGRYTLYVGRADIYGNRNFTQSEVQITVQ